MVTSIFSGFNISKPVKLGIFLTISVPHLADNNVRSSTGKRLFYFQQFWLSRTAGFLPMAFANISAACLRRHITASSGAGLFF